MVIVCRLSIIVLKINTINILPVGVTSNIWSITNLLREEFRAGPRFQESSRYWDPTEFTSLAFKFLDFWVYFYCDEPSFLYFLDEMISGISMSKMYLLYKDICYFQHFKLLSKTTATLSLKIQFFIDIFPFPVHCTI